MKICTKCGQEKEDKFFGKWHRACKKCCSKQTVEWKRKNREKAIEYQKKYREKNRESLNKKAKESRDFLTIEEKRNIFLRREHGITLEEYNTIFEKQNGCCIICGAVPSECYYGLLVVDHDHITGNIRGLLCSKCNAGIGLLQDNPMLLEKARKYVLS